MTLQAQAMAALRAAGEVMLEEMRDLASVQAPRKRAPYFRWGRTFTYRATEKATHLAPPRKVNGWLRRNLKCFRKGERTVRLKIGVPYAMFLEKGTRHAGKHELLKPAYEKARKKMWDVFVRRLRG